MENPAVANLGEDGSKFLASMTNQDSYDLEQLCRSLKELRVLMQTYQKQESFRKMLEEQNIDFFQVLINVVKKFQTNDQSKLTLSYGFQTAINCMVSNNTNKTLIFENLIQQQEADLKILLEYLAQDQKLMRFFAMILNSIFSEFSKEKVIDSWKISQYRVIFHGALSYFFHEEQSGKDVEHQNDQIFEWFYYLLSNIINVSNYLVFFQTQKSLLNILWRIVDQADFDPYDENNPPVDLKILDKTKLRFLYFLHNAFEKTISEKSQTSLIINYTPQNASIHELYDKKRELGINISVPDYVFLIKIFNQLSENLINEIQNLRDHNFENVQGQKPLLSSTLDYFHAILKLFCQITFLGGYNKTVQEIFITNNTLASALKVFQIIYQLDRDLNKETEPKIPVKITDVFDEDGYFELYLNFLRLISNIVHINLAAQNYISENNYLYLLLSFTVIDPKNPYIREWSIILIKNLTEANPAIQEKIAKLKTTDLDSKSKELLKKFQYDPDPSLFQEREEEEETDDKF